MMSYASILIVGLSITLLSAMPPLIHYFRLYFIDYLPLSYSTSQKLPEVTVVIPARDESNLICEKIEEILDMDYPKSKVKILVIDSASIDDTREKSKEYLSNYSGEVEWKIVQVQIPGKSLAVNTALEMIDTDFFVLTDVDSRLPRDSLAKLISGLLGDDRIGAICGSMSISEGLYMGEYRARFNFLRYRESFIDSTPIFEGSICAFRSSAVSSYRISDNINADDSQLALICWRNGFRAVMQEGIEFSEPFFPSKQQRIRSLRRAQGIVRVLLKNKDLALGRKSFNRIFLQNLYFYVIMPWISLLGILISMLGIIPVLYYGEINTIYSVGILLIVCFSFYSRLIRGFISGVMLLIHSQLLLLRGVHLNQWKPFREIS